ncbi:MAG: efflux RND transporter permease subunit [Myxococcales bacterium]|nr:efflux RND transporter permease subunit [Myxococcales bacterium]
MTLSDLSIKRPVFTTMMSVLLLVLGLLGLTRLGTDLFPDVSFPFVAITTVYRGAGPGEIEQQVVKPIEDAAAAINGVDTIMSFSRENVGIVFVQFKLTVPLDRALDEVRDKVAGVQGQLPREAELPRVSKIDLGAAPVLTYAVNAELPSTELKQLIKDRLEPALSQLEGVAAVRTVGGDTREIRVDVDTDQAKAAGVAPGQLAERIGMENLDVPAGRLDLGPNELTVRALGQFETVEQLENLPVARNPVTGSQVLLREVATVTDGVADRRTVARLNGKDAVIVEVVKQPGSNTVEVAKGVKAKMAGLSEAMGHGFGASILIDSSTIIEENAKEVWVALIFGGLMAVVIILLFLLDLRGTFISSLALPTSVIGTFFVMYVLGYTLNQMTLLSLSLAIGLLIDDAVVVREAITHRLEEGESPKDAASRGTRDVFLAVLATTLSLVAVFVPVAFMPGIVGQFFKQFGFTISAAVLISMFISFTLDPMLSSRLSKQRGLGDEEKENRVAKALRRSFEDTERWYERVLGWTLKHPWKTAGLTLAVIGASFFAASGLGNDFMTPEDRGQFIVELKLPEGSSLTQSEERAKQAEALLSPIPDVTDVYALIGADPNGFGGDVNTVRLRVLTKPRAKRALGIPQLKEVAREKLSTLPATQVSLIDPPAIEGMGDFFPMMLYVMGPDFAVLKSESERVGALLKGLKNEDGEAMATDVRVVANPPRPELAVEIDRTRAQDTGLTSAMLGMQLRLAMNGQTVGKLRQGSVETDIVVRLAEEDRGTPEALKQLDVFTPAGVRPVGAVANVEVREAPSVIEHFDRQRRVMIVASPGPGASLGALASRVKAELKAAPLPPGYTLFYDGQMKVLAEQNDAFALVFLLAFVFVYMVLASQFESFKHPFTIMVSVPLALVGALLALVVTGFSITMGAMIGLILLMGLVTKNAILLVDQALQNLRAGDDLDTALLKAGPRRLRPILMTSAAMAIGMVPTALGRGQGFEFRAPMALAVIGGVITSTFLTLLVVPLVFATFEKLTPKSLRIGRQDGGPPAATPDAADELETGHEEAAPAPSPPAQAARGHVPERA